MRTWKAEALFVAAVLAGTAVASGGEPINWLVAAAVLFTFMHAQVGFRLQEAEERRAKLERDLQSLSQRYEHAADGPPLEDVLAAQHRLEHHVECWRKQELYFVAKEVLWFASFLYLGAWPALVGVVVFLAYPAWRRWWRRRGRGGGPRGPGQRLPRPDGREGPGTAP